MIYVHIPFCRSFCTYCDFYSEVAPRCPKAEDVTRQAVLFETFADALSKEFVAHSEEVSKDVNTLYIGGGTPSVLPLSTFARLLDVFRSRGHGGPYDEFTIEVNPEDIVEKGRAYAEGLLELGVNRISMGVQSFDDDILRFMNRRHDAAAARVAYGILEDAGFENISIDLIFGLPQLSDAVWRDTLKRAMDISAKGVLPKHVSSYQLSVEPGSALAGLVERGLWTEASEDLCRGQYDILCDVLGGAGYHHYEISNFALPGYEARHNSAYWKHVPYLGLGPGAHSLAVSDSGKPVRRWNAQNLHAYVADPLSVSEGEELTDGQVVLERVMLGLRTSEGLAEEYLLRHCDATRLEQHLSSGDIVRTSFGTLRIPESRFFVSDAIISSLV